MQINQFNWSQGRDENVMSLFIVFHKTRVIEIILHFSTRQIYSAISFNRILNKELIHQYCLL